jgi:hypothetical protein
MLDVYGGRPSYACDRLNRLTGIGHPVAECTTIAYDVVDRQTMGTLANGVAQRRRYDAAGNRRNAEPIPHSRTIAAHSRKNICNFAAGLVS